MDAQDRYLASLAQNRTEAEQEMILNQQRENEMSANPVHQTDPKATLGAHRHEIEHWPTCANGYGVCDCGATIRVEGGKPVGGWHTCPLCTPRFYAPAAPQDDNVDPALYGLPQDSEIGPEFYPAPEPARGWSEPSPDGVLIRSGLLTDPPAGWDVAEPGPEQTKTARETLADFRTFAHSTYGPSRDAWPRVTRQIEDQLVGKAFDEADPLREARP